MGRLYVELFSQLFSKFEIKKKKLEGVKDRITGTINWIFRQPNSWWEKVLYERIFVNKWKLENHHLIPFNEIMSTIISGCLDHDVGFGCERNMETTPLSPRINHPWAQGSIKVEPQETCAFGCSAAGCPQHHLQIVSAKTVSQSNHQDLTPSFTGNVGARGTS